MVHAGCIQGILHGLICSNRVNTYTSINTDRFKALAARVVAPGHLAAAMSLWQHSDSKVEDSALRQDALEVLVPSQTVGHKP